MITIMLQGGMGNQMFEYATGLAQARRFNTGLILDTTSLFTERLRQYSLGLWEGVTEHIVTGSPVTVQENQMPYDPFLNCIMNANSTLRGYWQTEKWFGHIRGELLEKFHPKQRITGRGFETLKEILRVGQRSAFITVRRSDYVGSDFHNVLTPEYYREACYLVHKHTPFPHFFVFSDEPEWCKKNFEIPYDFTVVGSYDQTTHTHLGREDEDLWLMRNCRHAVMANSSFSWWGAWLNPQQADRVVVAPKKWFHDAAGIDTRDMVPERWTRI